MKRTELKKALEIVGDDFASVTPGNLSTELATRVITCKYMSDSEKACALTQYYRDFISNNVLFETIEIFINERS